MNTKNKIIAAAVAIIAAFTLSSCTITEAYLYGSDYSCQGSTQVVRTNVVVKVPDNTWKIVATNGVSFTSSNLNWKISGVSVPSNLTAFTGSSKAMTVTVETATGERKTLFIRHQNGC